MNRKKKLLQLNQKIDELEYSLTNFSLEFETFDCDNPDILKKMKEQSKIIDDIHEDCSKLEDMPSDVDFKNKSFELQEDIETETSRLNLLEFELSEYCASLSVDEYTELN